MTGSRWKLIKRWFLNRLAEKTTWLGVLGILAGATLITMDENTMMYVASVLSSLGGLIGILWNEKPKKKIKKKETVQHDDSSDKTTITFQ